MAAGLEDSSPRYLSARSSDVILSDIRPIKLKVEALRSVNAFLDELLWNILGIARSLSTDRLKSGLLKILPTTLGKEALLEAEVELKAYWERTNPTSNPNASVAEGEEFPLDWSFELLRLKCEAYSTLNDSDEDFNAENRLSERMRDIGCIVPPPAALIAPAALYLTAIIEYICEHILSNVSRVVARDSSKASAGPHDLFVALCEDSTVYGAFKVMKVYDHIENLQKVTKVRRSKSFSREKFAQAAHTASLQSDLSASARETPTSQSRLRMSTDSTTLSATAVQPPRASMDKARSKLFGHSRSTSDVAPESPMHHKRTESGYSDSANGSFDLEDQAMMDEFDELMRSGTTMKVSLTPDRLKSMEVYNKEKKRAGNRKQGSSKREASNGTHEELPVAALMEVKRASQRMPALRHVDSIIEDEEEAQIHTATSTSMRSFPSTPLAQKFSIAPTPHMVDTNGRVRAISTTQSSQGPAAKLLRKSSWNTSKGRPSPPPKPTSKQAEDRPPRTRKAQRNLENMDLDEIMNGSEEEEDQKDAPPPPSSYKGPTKATGPAGTKISRSAQELIDFLAEGPPPEPSPLGRASPQNAQKSKSGRLGRMMSKLTGAPSNERLREEAMPKKKNSLPISSGQQSAYAQSSLPASTSNPTVVLPSPPRPPRPTESIIPVSPPATPATPTRENFAIPESRTPAPIAKVAASRKTASPFDASRADPMRLAPPSRQSSRGSPFNQSKESLHSISSMGHAVNGHLSGSGLKRDLSLSEQSRTDSDGLTNGKNSEDETPRPAPLLTTARVDDLRRLLSSATTADECRVLTDMFLARIGFPVKRVGDESPYSTPMSDPADTKQESSLVEVLLCGSPTGSESSFSTPTESPIPNHIRPVARPPRNESRPSPTDSRPSSLQNIQDTQLHQHSQRTLAVA